jgi:benzil reductase ((S)-benzoin forming)
MQRAIVITGTSSGLGRALFEQLSERETLVVAIARRFHPEQKKANAMLIECDLGDMNAVKKCVEKLRDVLANTSETVFINNAFVIEPIGPIGALSDDDIVRALQVNVTSSMMLVNALMKLRSSSQLSLINVTSGAAVMPISGWAIYCACKAAMRMFFSVLKKQSPDISVHEFEPGVVDTPMQEKLRQSDFPDVATFKTYKDSGRLRDANEVAGELIKKFDL